MWRRECERHWSRGTDWAAAAIIAPALLLPGERKSVEADGGEEDRLQRGRRRQHQSLLHCGCCRDPVVHETVMAKGARMVLRR